MSEKGFCIRALSLIGASVPEARVEFDSGFSLIVGPSDTGKSFILQCIDYMLGGGKAPKEIPEAAGYESARLEIVVREFGNIATLERSRRGGGFRLHMQDEPPRNLLAKHAPSSSAGDRSVSGFLLQAFG